jgi:hypothetical protein
MQLVESQIIYRENSSILFIFQEMSDRSDKYAVDDYVEARVMSSSRRLRNAIIREAGVYENPKRKP